MSAKKFLLLAGIALSVSACTDGDVGNEPPVGQSEDEIINGTPIPAPHLQPIANIRYVFSGLTGFVEGSGVFLTKEMVVTAKHVVRGFPSQPNPMFAHVRQGDLTRPERAITSIVTQAGPSSTSIDHNSRAPTRLRR